MEAMVDQVDAFGEPFGPRLHGAQTELEVAEQNFGVACRLRSQQLPGLCREVGDV